MLSFADTPTNTPTMKNTAIPTAALEIIASNAAAAVDQRGDYPNAASATEAYWENVVDTCDEYRLPLPRGSRTRYLLEVATEARRAADARRAARSAAASAAQWDADYTAAISAAAAATATAADAVAAEAAAKAGQHNTLWEFPDASAAYQAAYAAAYPTAYAAAYTHRANWFEGFLANADDATRAATEAANRGAAHDHAHSVASRAATEAARPHDDAARAALAAADLAAAADRLAALDALSE